jgi:hypothetical protein
MQSFVMLHFFIEIWNPLKSKFKTFIDYLILCIHIYIYISTVEEHIFYYLIITSTIQYGLIA